MANRFSHSQLNRYLLCPKSYELHYIKKFRSTKQSAALLFGTAFDKASEYYAKHFNQTGHLVTIKEKAHKVFQETWFEQEFNGTATKLQSCTEIVYGDNDLDLELIGESDHEPLDEDSDSKAEPVLTPIGKVLKRKEDVGFKYLKKEEKLLLNDMNWRCMNVKGQLMLDAFMEWFDNNVIEVLATQKIVQLDDGNGNSVLGYADLVARVKGQDKPVVLDVKTAGRAYDYDAVLKSTQLSLYVYSLSDEFEQTNTAGYIVLHKSMNKKRTKICSVCGFDGSEGRSKTCNNTKPPEGKQKKGTRCSGAWNETFVASATMQYLVNEIPEILKNRVLENYEYLPKAIEAEIFPRNFESCVRYNKKVICDFYDLCHCDKMTDLIKKEEK